MGMSLLTASATVAEVNAVAVAIRSSSSNFVRSSFSTNFAPYCSRPAVLGGCLR